MSSWTPIDTTGLSVGLRKNLLETAQLLKAANTVQELAVLLEVEYAHLVYWTYRVKPSHKYTRFSIRKSSGNKREILAPANGLKVLQRKVSDILSVLVAPKPSCHGFTAGRSILTNARVHVRKRVVLNVDLEEFFPSIHFGRVYGSLKAWPLELSSKIAAAIAQLCCFENGLPQGAPSSPMLANLVCRKLDSELQLLAKQHSCTYTRYADDLTFSTYRDLPKSLAMLRHGDGAVCDVGDALSAIVVANDFRINEAKTRLRHRSWHQEVTGIVVNKRPNVSRRYVKQLRAMIHAWEKFGYDAAEKVFHDKYERRSRRLSRKPSFRHVVLGKLAHLAHVKGEADPVVYRLARRLASRDNSIKRKLEERRHELFICHASEDKAAVARPIRDELDRVGVRSWLDEAEIGWGDGVVDRINSAIAQTEYALLVISLASINKKWPMQELQALVAQAIEDDKVILPLLVGNEGECQQIVDRLPLLRAHKWMPWKGDAAEAARWIQGVITAHARKAAP